MAVRWSRIGDTFIEKSEIPLGVHLIRIGLKSTVRALDSLGGGFWGIVILNFTIRASCLLSNIGTVLGQSWRDRASLVCWGGVNMDSAI